MILSPEQLEAQTRQLWQLSFPSDSADFLDLYFAQRYTTERNVTQRHNAQVLAAAQVLPFRFNFAGKPIQVGYISGLCTHPDHRGKGLGSKVMRESHRKMWNEGQLISFLIPGNEKLRKWYEKQEHGAYWTATHRLSVDVTPKEDFRPDLYLDIMPEEQWGRELWQYYNTFGGRHPYEMRLDEPAFSVAIQTHLLSGGKVLVARRRGKIVGFCLALREGKPLKSGKPSTKNFRGLIRYLITTDEHIMRQLQYRAMQVLEVKDIVMQGGCPGKGFEHSRPYAMARIINVEAFLRFIGRIYPGLQLHVGIDGDLDLPENNGYYQLMDGQLTITDQRPDNIITPGGLAALFLGAQPTLMAMLLDE